MTTLLSETHAEHGSDDPRLGSPAWDGRHGAPAWRVRALVALNLALAVFYLTWLLRPERVGAPLLYALLVAAEVFNVTQALGFWWTIARARPRRRRAWHGEPPDVDVLVPVCGEPVEIVEPTIAAATNLHGANVSVLLLDDGDDEAMRALAARHGARYITRRHHTGAKAGNINHALRHSAAQFVAVLDCDHVPQPEFLSATLGWLQDDDVAFVQTPQDYANARANRVAGAAWAQQALFFGAIARGKDRRGAMFCAGTNVVFRRRALEQVGGFPEDSLTEDFALSLRLHERGWRSAYVPEVLARGLGPEDMASYASQQQRWARGCLGALAPALRARLPLRMRAQYALSCAWFLTGWTVLIYVSFPVIRIITGEQPLAGATADEFLAHFAPYFASCLLTVALAGAGAYTFAGFALATASWWIHVQASLRALVRRRGRFVVTPKSGAAGAQPRAVWPTLVVMLVLAATVVLGLARDRTPATLNNVAFATLHFTVLTCGVAAALMPARRRRGVRALRVALAVSTAAVAVAGLSVAGAQVIAPAPSAPRAVTDPGPARAVAIAAGRRFLEGYVGPDGRVVRRDQGEDTVSEGQAYAMLVAAAVGDRPAFERVWGWTQEHLQRDDGLLASHWQDGEITDPNPATDADLDAAHALLLAHERWHDVRHARAARAIGAGVLAHETLVRGGRRLLSAGPWAHERGVVNPSYFAPRALQSLERATGGRSYVRVARDSRAALRGLLARGALPPDWASAGDDGRLRPTGPPGGGPIAYGFEAVRVPLRLAGSCNAGDRRMAAGLWPRLRRARVLPLTLRGRPAGTIRHAAGLVGSAAAARAAGDRAASKRRLDAATALDRERPTYYGSALVALGRLMLDTDRLRGC